MYKLGLRLFLRPYWNFIYFKYKSIFNYNPKQTIYYPNLILKPKIYIDPKKIRYYRSLFIKPKKGCRYFLEGDWDEEINTIEKTFNTHPKYITAKQIIDDNYPIEKTKEYKHINEYINTNGSYKNINNPKIYMDNIYNLYKSLSANGYDTFYDNRINKWTGGIECVLGRNMKLIKINGGNHRFAASYILGIKNVPVHICALHSSYLNIFYKNGFDGITSLVNQIEKEYQ